jgi:hypothetical protein
MPYRLHPLPSRLCQSLRQARHRFQRRSHQSAGDALESIASPMALVATSPERSPSPVTSPLPAPASWPSAPPSPAQLDPLYNKQKRRHCARQLRPSRRHPHRLNHPNWLYSQRKRRRCVLQPACHHRHPGPTPSRLIQTELFVVNAAGGAMSSVGILIASCVILTTQEPTGYI